MTGLRKVLKTLLLIVLLILGMRAAYLKYELRSAVVAYERAGVPENETLVAAYHHGNTWQFATYIDGDGILNVYTVEWKPLSAFILGRLDRKVERAEALVNYSPLAMEVSLLRNYRPHQTALLFKTLGWVYGDKVNGSYLPAFSDVIKPGEVYYSIEGTGSRDKIWIKTKTICDPPSLFAHDYVCRGFIGYEGLLTIPGYSLESGQMVWVVKKLQGDKLNITVFYPGISLSTTIKAKRYMNETMTFTGKSVQLLREAIPKVVWPDITYIQVWVSDDNGNASVEGIFLLPNYRYGTFEESLGSDGS